MEFVDCQSKVSMASKKVAIQCGTCACVAVLLHVQAVSEQKTSGECEKKQLD